MSRLKQNNYMERKPVKEINLKEYFEVIRKRFWVIILVTVIATSVGYFYTNMNNVPLYQTSTRIILGSDSDMKTLMVMIKDPIIMEMVKNDLELSRSSDSIANQIQVTRIEDSQVIKIAVTDTNPELAVAIANSTAASFKSGIADILDFKEVQLLSAAEENPFPINSSQNKIVIVASVFGLLTGIGLVFLLDTLDGTVRKESEIEDILGVPVIGVVPNMNRQKFIKTKSKSDNKQKQEFKQRGETVDIK
ncbi:YveK family protein [Virgibacillus doumboii]|uniref:YveK family protein n=1 Tax=Virgibacillus doumboii TaxID=2697503 RepID=UPI0013DEB658|nr:Wzz/FepE/Etk N-terminal domain-containing protein [Virgibacillus doumboii]